MKRIIKIAKRYANILKSEDNNLKAVYIFGSQVNGTATRDSDLDIAVVSSCFSGDRVNDRVSLMKKRRSVSYMIEPHPFLPEDFDDKYNFLAQEIKKTGIRII